MALMTAMDPVIPSGPSSAWIVAGLTCVAVGLVLYCAWSIVHAQPVGTPTEPQRAPTDGVDEHAETAAALTIPTLDPWPPTRVDPEDDIDGVLVEPPEWLAKDVIFAPVLAPDERKKYLRIAAHLLSDPDFTNRIDHILELH